MLKIFSTSDHSVLHRNVIPIKRYKKLMCICLPFTNIGYAAFACIIL